MRHRASAAIIVAALLVAAVPAANIRAQTAPAIEIYVHGNVNPAIQANYLRALEGSVKYYQDLFGELPVADVKMRLFENDELTAQGLMEFLGYSEEKARTYATGFSAFGHGKINTILVNTSKKRVVDLQVAHEFMHLLQYAWGGGKPSFTWLDEGMAQLYGARYAELSGGRTAEKEKQLAVPAVKSAWSSLSTISIFGVDWVRANQNYGNSQGYSVMYGYALLAYEYLEKRFSRETVLQFYGLLKASTPRYDAFERAFRISTSNFENDLKSYITTLF